MMTSTAITTFNMLPDTATSLLIILSACAQHSEKAEAPIRTPPRSGRLEKVVRTGGEVGAVAGYYEADTPRIRVGCMGDRTEAMGTKEGRGEARTTPGPEGILAKGRSGPGPLGGAMGTKEGRA